MKDIEPQSCYLMFWNRIFEMRCWGRAAQCGELGNERLYSLALFGSSAGLEKLAVAPGPLSIPLFAKRTSNKAGSEKLNTKGAGRWVYQILGLRGAI